ncbi:Esterase PHB depolymerase [Duganella sp. CF458]|uniref:extracellular catalytic domain type 2 short-chain-length polyhydroxyalkanoate depolymerase n=1 Tax=Duganella sp. CF458 TaxID=1884368 RepID=UPI0008F18C93|nr:PHB depolymerase family esterase [Duganella sp. CF458]SFF60054.1 Esterase PHB depolymerase [Duganella sp. CF458]
MTIAGCTLALAAATQASAAPAPLPSMKARQVSISGLSSGAFMAVQYQVAYSGSVVGAGIIAGGSYYCAQGSMMNAIGSCKGADVAELAAVTRKRADAGQVDPVAKLASHRVWMFSGTLDQLVPAASMADLAKYYAAFIPAAQIQYKSDLAAGHAMPTDSYGNKCDALAAPFISNCGFDAAGNLLQWIYGPLKARGDNATPAGRLQEFEQAEFIPAPTTHGMANTGYVYIPPGCEAGGAGCKLHIALHGCMQDIGTLKDTYARHAGYNAWADTNRIVVLYPQTAAISPMPNPKACWDWWGYDDPDYSLQSGRQLRAIKRMADRLTGA